jgi:Ala-tRNA(Pro) deacylase
MLTPVPADDTVNRGARSNFLSVTALWEFFTMAVPRWLQFILDYHGVPYEVHHHPPVFSASRLAHLEHVSGHWVAKTVILADHGHPVTVVLPACARLDLPWAQLVLASPHLRLATEPEIAGWFKGCAPGAVPPLRLRSDQQIVMDRTLAHLGSILFAAGTLEDAVVMRFRDWYRLVQPGIGRFALPLHGSAIPKPPAPGLITEDEEEMSQVLCRF